MRAVGRITYIGVGIKRIRSGTWHSSRDSNLGSDQSPFEHAMVVGNEVELQNFS
jgi:hypothetical protein